jgi:hypothetical protein
MFKYIKEILVTISPAQRLWALTILLFSIALISVGPKIVESFTSTDMELKAITDRQRLQILQLNEELGKTNLEIIKAKTECTDLVVQREKEILGMIEDLQKGMGNNRNPFEVVQREPASGSNGGYDVINGDTIRVARSMAPQPQRLEDDRVPHMMEGLNKIKSKIQKDIKRNAESKSPSSLEKDDIPKFE